MNVIFSAASTKNATNPCPPELVKSILAGVLSSIVPELRPISNANVSLNVVVVVPLVWVGIDTCVIVGSCKIPFQPAGPVKEVPSAIVIRSFSSLSVVNPMSYPVVIAGTVEPTKLAE